MSQRQKVFIAKIENPSIGRDEWLSPTPMSIGEGQLNSFCSS